MTGGSGRQRSGSSSDAASGQSGSAGLTERDVGDSRTVTAGEFVEDLRENLTPEEFEHFVADVYDALGYETKVTQGTGDRGVDVIAKGGGEKIIIQAKLYGANSTVGGPDVREYAALFKQESADRVVIVNTGSFTRQAHEIKSRLDVEFVDGEDLFDLVAEHDLGHLVAKYTGHIGEYEAGEDSQGVSVTQVVGDLAPVWAALSTVSGIAGGLWLVETIAGVTLFGSTPSVTSSAPLSLFVLLVFLSMFAFPASLFVNGNRLKYPVTGAIGLYLGISFLTGGAGMIGMASLTIYGLLAGVYLVDRFTPLVPCELAPETADGRSDAGADERATGQETGAVSENTTASGRSDS